jgi:hypothetical protein
MFKLILFTLFCACYALPKYGLYCGRVEKEGTKPIEQLDRYCQIYQICENAMGKFNCFCMEQFYYYVCNYSPINGTAKIKDEILSWAFSLLVGCDNFDHLEKYVISPYSAEHGGYWYVPFYAEYHDGRRFRVSANEQLYYFLTSAETNLTTISQNDYWYLADEIIDPENQTVVFCNMDIRSPIMVSIEYEKKPCSIAPDNDTFLALTIVFAALIIMAIAGLVIAYIWLKRNQYMLIQRSFDTSGTDPDEMRRAARQTYNQ